jgi:hypothetical protein
MYSPTGRPYAHSFLPGSRQLQFVGQSQKVNRVFDSDTERVPFGRTSNDVLATFLLPYEKNVVL